MAKRECPYCKEKVKDDAVICKHCKSELPPIPPKKWYQTWKGLLIIIVGIGLFGNVLMSLSVRKTTTPPVSEVPIAVKATSDPVGAKKRQDFAIVLMKTYNDRGSDLIVDAIGKDSKTLMCWSKEFNRSFVSVLMKEGFAEAPKSVGFTSIEFYKDPSHHIISYDLSK